MEGMATSKSVLISGASTGIGRACALELARRGFLVFAGVRKIADREELVREASGQIIPVLLDVTRSDSVRSTVERVRPESGDGSNGGDGGDGGLAGLVNNAGVAVAGPLEFLPLESFREQFELNVFGLLALTQACLPLLRQRRGRIVNIGSIAGRVATPLIGAYAASKFAVEAMSDTLRREPAPWGLQVALVEPGRITTPIWQKSAQAATQLLEQMPPEAAIYYGAAIARSEARALRRAQHGTPASEVAKVVHHALTAPQPRTRYLVGRDARIAAALARLLPDRWLDRYLGGGRRPAMQIPAVTPDPHARS